jgi:hypothetical protein
VVAKIFQVVGCHFAGFADWNQSAHNLIAGCIFGRDLRWGDTFVFVSTDDGEPVKDYGSPCDCHVCISRARWLIAASIPSKVHRVRQI